MATDGVLQPIDAIPMLGRRRIQILLLGILVVVSVFLMEMFIPDVRLLPRSMTARIGAETLLTVFLLSLGCGYVGSALGGGYGTILSPILGSGVFLGLTFGFDNYVPALLISEFFTGLAGGVLHNRHGNVDWRGDRTARKTAILLSLMSILGVVGAVYIKGMIEARFDPAVAGATIKGIIGGIIFLTGIITLVTIRHRFRYRPAHIVGLGAIAAFNKAFSGGGYGPLVTSGQVVSGLSPKQAVACTAMASAFASFVGVIVYLCFRGHLINWPLVPVLTLGSLLSVPMATLTVRRLPETFMRASVGILTILLALNMLFSSVLGLY